MTQALPNRRVAGRSEIARLVHAVRLRNFIEHVH
jgi:hypothetical protein